MKVRGFQPLRVQVFTSFDSIQRNQLEYSDSVEVLGVERQSTFITNTYGHHIDDFRRPLLPDPPNPDDDGSGNSGA